MRTHNMKKIDLNAYQDFVKAVTSKPSNDLGEIAWTFDK